MSHVSVALGSRFGPDFVLLVSLFTALRLGNEQAQIGRAHV